jgi:phytoene synthase
LIDDIPDPRLDEAYGHCERQLRAGDRDRWLACLFAPVDTRRHLHALYAFSLDIARVRDIVSDPMPGEIRFQWWRDVLEGEGRGDVAAHPVASAILNTKRVCHLPREALTNLVDARTFDLYDDPMPGMRQLDGYCGETSSALMRMAALVLSRGRDPGSPDIAGHGGLAYAIAGLLRALPWHAARGQCYVPLEILKSHGGDRRDAVLGPASPALLAALADLRAIARDHLAAAARELKTAPPWTAPAYLPLALVELYLKRMDGGRYDPFKTLVDVPQWRRQWALWRAGRR